MMVLTRRAGLILPAIDQEEVDEIGRTAEEEDSILFLFNVSTFLDQKLPSVTTAL